MVASAWDWLRSKTPLVDAFFALPLLLVSLPSMTSGHAGTGAWLGERRPGDAHGP